MSFLSHTSRTILAEEVVCKHTELKSNLHIQWYVVVQKTQACVVQKLEDIKLFFLAMYNVLLVAVLYKLQL